MSDIKIPVYKGEKLREDKKILIVGESYYSDDSTYYNGDEKVLNDFPKLVMNRYFHQVDADRWNIKFFNNITEFLTCNGIIKDNLQEVYYYNYVQKILQRTINGKINKAKWKADIRMSTKAFYEVVNQIKPDVIIFFSFSAFDAATYYISDSNSNFSFDQENLVNETHYKKSEIIVGDIKSNESSIRVFRFPHLTGGPVGWSFKKSFNKLAEIKMELSKYEL
ncbi:hypothetical protein [Breznakia pachnodae]|uniref:Uncharacterized protein n=1 Tax=Breznakia pachnodae TaxID=265178 RepID=A0ABU0DXT6_9FIRM|nr:hypothetical protein [Breznakia pachnodae]MDQ0359447.1 hypothetical protein [Breznakia pachnodae]